MNKDICDLSLGNARQDWDSLICSNGKEILIYVFTYAMSSKI
jgi:hypothetical protein